MKKSLYAAFLMLLTATGIAQEKKWTLAECVDYALKNNIQIKNTELDGKLADVDKKAAFGNFLPTVNGQASHSWNIGLNQNITTGLLENQTTQFTSAGVSVGVNIYSGLQSQNRLRRANLAILAAQYQLTKMKDDVALNVANAIVGVVSRGGNGLDATQGGPSVTCEGADNVATKLSPFKELVTEAFERADARPKLERKPEEGCATSPLVGRGGSSRGGLALLTAGILVVARARRRLRPASGER